MVRPTKRIIRHVPGAEPRTDRDPQRGGSSSEAKDKYFVTNEQRRASKYEARPSGAPPPLEEPELEIIIDLRDDSAYADEPAGQDYYLRIGPRRDNEAETL